jgi:hypothetical protein
MRLKIVQMLAEEYEGNAPNALRALLRKAVDQIRPEGERRFTSEWILYNILEMKFIEGRKVREVAGRLAMSEADLYRKQRVAVEAVARAILDMEQNEALQYENIMDANNNNTKRKYESPMPVTDEGWWESVLAEERQYAPPRPQPATGRSKTIPQARAEPMPATPVAEIDWNMVKELYANDRIIELKVTGHNRGGLLVEKDGLSGFIPFSHLIELAGREQEADREVSLESYNGKTLRVKVIECVPEEGRVVFSERSLAGPPNEPS